MKRIQFKYTFHPIMLTCQPVNQPNSEDEQRQIKKVGKRCYKPLNCWVTSRATVILRGFVTAPDLLLWGNSHPYVPEGDDLSLHPLSSTARIKRLLQQDTGCGLECPSWSKHFIPHHHSLGTSSPPQKPQYFSLGVDKPPPILDPPAGTIRDCHHPAKVWQVG